MAKERNVNFEILRVVAMLMVLLLHAFNFGGLLGLPGEQLGGPAYYATWYLEALCYGSVNVFVLITGYFMVGSRFRLKRMGRVWLQTFFYSAGIGLAAWLLLKKPFEQLWLVPATNGVYWYVTSYLLLCLFAPFLNRLIRAMDRRAHLTLVLLLVAAFVLVPTLAGAYSAKDYLLQNGYSLGWFITLYFVAAYVRLYRKPTRHPWAYLAASAGFAALTLALTLWVFQWMQQISGFEIRVWNAYQYNSLPVFGMSVCLLLGFQGLRIRAEGKPARFFLAIAPYAFGVYLIHTHPALKETLWLDFIGLPRLYGSPWLVPLVLAVVPILFLLLCGVDWLRAQLMRLTGLERLTERLCDAAEKRVRGFLTRLAPDPAAPVAAETVAGDAPSRSAPAEIPATAAESPAAEAEPTQKG